jgi:PAS domain S-box-containing protein
MTNVADMADREKTKEELFRDLAEARAEAETLKTEFMRVERALKKALGAARQERDKTSALIEAMGDGISVQDTSYRILLQNQFHRDMVGDHVGEHCYAAYQKRDSVCPECHLAIAFKDGRIHKREQSRTVGEETRYYEITASPVKDSSGKIIAGIEAVRDISKRKRAEKALQESEIRYRTLFENAGDAIFILDAEGEKKGRIVDANRAAAQMHGYEVEELLKLNIAALDAPVDARKMPRRVDRIIREGWIKKELAHRRKDGTLFPVEISAGLLELESHKYIFAFDRDITERKKHEEQREKLISELRNALEKIRTLSGLLPICAWCKKIRDDRGYWKKVEEYLEEHSDAQFTHGICPECLKENSPEVYEKLQAGDKKRKG